MAKQENPDSYLFTAIRNRLRKRHKRRRLFPVLTKDLEASLEAEPPFTTKIFEAEEANKRTQILAQQLANLPARQQQVLYLRFYEDKSYEEIARVMDTTIGVARNFVYRGLQKLRASPWELKQVLLFVFTLQEAI